MAAKVESSKARAAFEAYVALGPARSLEKLHQNSPQTAPSLRSLKEWSRLYGWLERARLADAEVAMRERAQREAHQAAERERRHKRRLADIDTLHELADEAAQVLGSTKALTEPRDVLRFYEFLHKGERLEMGDPSAIVTYQDVSDADLAQEARAAGFIVHVPAPRGDAAPELDD